MASGDFDLAKKHGPVKRGRLNDGFKQRIVGALVLAALAVIFLPTLFDREGARYIDITSQVPPAPDIQPIEIAEPRPVTDVAPAPAPEDAFQPELVEQSSERSESATQQPVAESEIPAAQNDEAPILDARGLPVAWAVQVASYSEESRAERLRAKLMDEGYKAYTRAVINDKGRFIRVLVGPKVREADARRVKRELDQLLGTETLVLRFKP